MNSTPLIQARNLSRWYGIVMGLNNVSFDVPSGLTGLVGPNGAGKSTFIRLVTGQMQPSFGELTVLGGPTYNNPEILSQIGFCPEEDALPDDLTPLPWLCGLGMLSGLASAQARARARQMLELVRLGSAHWEKPLGQYSKGMRQRVKLAQALMHQPRLLVLDEPMNGLDPGGRQEMRQIYQELATTGTSILISSHILQELEMLCPMIIILNWGRVLASGDQQALRMDLQSQMIRFFVRCERPDALIRTLFAEDWLIGFERQEDGLNLQLRPLDDFATKWAELMLAQDFGIYEFRQQSRSLQDIYETITAE